MIRFMPDSLLEALVRPIAMAVPGGSIYVETIAPDFRFVFVLALLLAWVVWRVRPRAAAARTTALLVFCVAAFVPWLATTGNGRYFLPVLLLVGPLCIAMLHHLPWPRRARAGAAAAMLAVQALLLLEVTPWNSWGLAPWRTAPAFPIELPEDLRQSPATYVTVSGISYSLLAPGFHPASRWVNLTSQHGRPSNSTDMQRVQALLEDSPRMFLLFPGQTLQEQQPPEALTAALNLSLVDHGLRLPGEGACRLLPSAGLTSVGSRPGQPLSEMQPRGFWLCPLERSAAGADVQRAQPPAQVEAALNRIEQQCPRMFAPGSAVTTVLPMGYRRFYPDSDMRLYVLSDGRILYKYMRALNAVVLGRAEEVLAPAFRMDCNIRGRAGLPWEREI